MSERVSELVIDYMYRAIEKYIDQCKEELNSERKHLQSFHALNDCIESYTATIKSLVKFNQQVEEVNRAKK